MTNTESATFFANLCPDADTERLQMAVDWTYLTFRFDDMQCEQESDNSLSRFVDVAVRFVRTLEEPDAGVFDQRSPFYAPLRDLARRLQELSTPVRIRRLVDAHRAWFSGVSWQLAYQADLNKVGLNDYVFTRLLHSAAFPTLTWIEISEKCEIPTPVRAAPAVHALTEMAGAVAAIDNDLLSYGKELWLSQQDNENHDPLGGNIVHIIALTERCGQQDALQAAVALRDRILVRFLEVHDSILHVADEPLRRYLDNLTSLIRGNYEFHLVADRYRNPDGVHPHAVSVHATRSDNPSASGPPAGLSSIAWWWRKLAVPSR
ncbi:hypothetical protein [Amycolatopsis sp. NPDC051071]|uniref:terpene synthase family protein n=1 Tax=Amycolatopsis sp. NPDC051071 TaxID=3154637 RepID=UPI0034191D75